MIRIKIPSGAGFLIEPAESVVVISDDPDFARLLDLGANKIRLERLIVSELCSGSDRMERDTCLESSINLIDAEAEAGSLCRRVKIAWALADAESALAA